MASIKARSDSKKSRAPEFKKYSLIWLNRGEHEGSSLTHIIEIKLDKQEHWSYLLLDPDTGLTVGWFREQQLGRASGTETEWGSDPTSGVSQTGSQKQGHDARRSSPTARTGILTTAELQSGTRANISSLKPSQQEPVIKIWTIECELLKFLVEEYHGKHELNDILVLRGGSVEAECLTCEEYTSKLTAELNTVAATTVLMAINLALTSMSKGFGSATKNNPHGLECVVDVISTSTETLITILADIRAPMWAADFEAINKFLGFIAAALRPAESPGLWISEVVVRYEESYTYISAKPLRKAVEQSCWHVLFPKKVIMSDPWIKPRDHDAVGLRAELPLLMHLCGIDVPVYEDGGITFQGVYTILVPISRDKLNNVQWHLLYVDPDKEDVLDSREKLLLSQVPRVRLLTSDIQELQNGTHFLGWVRSTLITLGTREQIYSTLRSSAARIKETEVVDSSTTVNLNFALHGLGGGISRTRKLGRAERNPFQNRDKSLRDWLISSKREQVLLHRPSRRQSWLVPKPAVLLYSVIAYMRNLEDEDTTLSYNWHQYLVSSGTAQQAYDALVSMTTDHAFRSTSSSSDHRDILDVSTRMRELEAAWKGTVTTLLHMMSAISRRSKVGRLNRKILGFELYDLIAQPQWFDLKESQISNTAFGTLGGWTRLLTDVPIVLFFEGINDPIISTKDTDSTGGHKQKSNTCVNQSRLAPDQNLMATTIGSLQDLARRRGGINNDGQVTETAYWHSPEGHQIFRDCSHQACGSGKCENRQFIWRGPGRPPLKQELKNSEGGIVFAAGTGLSEGLFS